MVIIEWRGGGDSSNKVDGGDNCYWNSWIIFWMGY
jgi:hypothetical protein